MLASRIKVTTATTGTGALTLSGTGVRDATNGDCLAPAERLDLLAHRLVTYFITSGGNYAKGKGTLSADGLTLTRDVHEENWNGSVYAAGLLSLTGTSTVFLSPDAFDLESGSLGATQAAVFGATFC